MDDDNKVTGTSGSSTTVSPSEQKQYALFKLSLHSDPDPLEPRKRKRYDDAIFVQKDAETGTGTIYQVTGSIASPDGMTYEEKPSEDPTRQYCFHKMTPLGHINKTDVDSGRVSQVLRAQPTPPRQQALDHWTLDRNGHPRPFMWVNRDGEAYAAGEKMRPVFKSTEWVAIYAIPALRVAGLLHEPEAKRTRSKTEPKAENDQEARA
ncbi:hypothetical protein BDZ85DRAFT_25877 [Elsinoe ampelina]|uniref:Uncharacterized protein n=1 Tax=Elsinoe ampelina TaxID=302913 RepID=A0A6A6G4N2_9PEZI|nr:hypothetical protein BDZ85DRAFT_25877 [Elsinoe ampelina]